MTGWGNRLEHLNFLFTFLAVKTHPFGREFDSYVSTLVGGSFSLVRATNRIFF